MGKHEEIWQSINDLDDRVTRLEERAILKPDYHPDDVAFDNPRTRIADLEREVERLTAERDEARRALIEAKQQRDSYRTERDSIANERDNLKKACTLAWDAIIERHRDWTSGVPLAVTQLIRLLNDAESERDALRAEVDKLSVAPTESARVITIRNQRNELRALNAKYTEVKQEADALRARIEAGRVMYGGMYGHQNKFEMWTFEHVDTDTMTARLIDIAPIADAGEIDERVGMADRRENALWFPPESHKEKPCHRVYAPILIDTKTVEAARSNDRRRTPGTRADRKA